MPFPACTSPASLSNKGRLVSHPLSINPLLAITNTSFDVPRKHFSTSRPEWRCSVVEPRRHMCGPGVNVGWKWGHFQDSGVSEEFLTGVTTEKGEKEKIWLHLEWSLIHLLKELLDFMVGEWAAQRPFQSAVPAEEGCWTLVPCFPSCPSRTWLSEFHFHRDC